MERTSQTPRDASGSSGRIPARVPCILLLDVSSATSGKPIEELNAGLVAYKNGLAGQAAVAQQIDLAVVSFGGQVDTLCDFTTADGFSPPQLTASGDTPLGEAIHQGIDLLQDHKQFYWTEQIPFHRPWVFLISASPPTDLWHSAAGRIRHGETTKAFSLFPVGLHGADFDNLRKLTTREPLRLKDLRFRQLFKWLANCAVRRCAVGARERVPLPNPASADGWATAAGHPPGGSSDAKAAGAKK